jgi:hypothetical protein
MYQPRVETVRLLVRSSPAWFAAAASGGDWIKAPHLHLLNERLIRLASERNQRLLVVWPPRHGKSQFISRYFPAWYLGRYPDRRVILCGYGDNFASEWGRKVRDLLQEYGPDWFGVAVRRDSAAADRWNIDGHEGGMVAVGVGGAIMGKGADLLVLDDVVKSFEEANSEVYRQKTWDWYISTAFTRLEPGGSVLLIMTRWHHDDIAGRLLAQTEMGLDSWEMIRIPALSETRSVWAELTIPMVKAAELGLHDGDRFSSADEYFRIVDRARPIDPGPGADS